MNNQSIIHDLRNPLAAIQGSAEVLFRSGLSQPQIDRIARNIYSASVRMRELLEEFLDRGRAATRQFELCDIRELVCRAVDEISVSAEFQQVEIAHDVPAGLAVSLDRRRMHRVLLNLLLNAMEAMPAGGRIDISAVAGRRAVLIQVRDTGPGIDPAILGQLFEPFATVGKPHGIGLGLATARQVLADHGGGIWAESSARGACFVASLPR